MKPIQKQSDKNVKNKWENNRTLSVKIVKMRSILISNQPLKLRRLSHPRQSTVEGEKLQKVLARAGQGSRREIEAMIAENRVSVDGKMATLGDRIDVHSGVKVRIDGRIINLQQAQKKYAVY